ncbi:hypothetical protein IKQ19_06455 [Candidatus Saccharibacteria bacterium]|nr:hypothetical protein [Candidatus Saccharibacteria bacterium]
MSLIENQFELKTKKGENKTEIIEAYRVLVNFWHCTKIHVPNVLSSVSQIFPHYTKHDASHSNAILDSIERILGKEAIEKLSVTDLWLLLCSAYYHDIGMYLSGDKIEECFKTDKFKNFLFDIKEDSKSPLNKYAVFFDSKDGKLKYDSCDLTLDSFNAARYLLAEFFRKSHADRSGDLLQSDSSVTQMFSEINRLITIIADICRLHGANFEEVMKFSDVENGVNGAEDYCHPRFVACMLRIGDLLDIDSSRVSKPSLDHLSTSIPYDSKIHNEKNFCIKHALITPEKVDVIAECKEPEVAFEIDNWFTLIRNEMSNQRNLWHDIASCTGIKGYPMCGTLETILLGYERIDNNLKPKFEIEGENAVKILQGSGIYKNKFRSIREILQNAVDATYLRIYLEQLKGKKEFAPESIEGFDKFLEICKQPEYQIEVRCKKKEIEEKSEKKKEENKNEKKKYVWHFEIQDHGIGIRKEDLKFLLKIGSGRNNKEKFDIIKKMPEYAKPSGIFGIGFQSIFLITNEVNIKSRYALCDEVIDIKIGTPLKGGFALLKTEKDPYADKGTTISFDLMENMVNDSSHVDYYSYYRRCKESFDFLRNKKCDLEVARILEAVDVFARYSYLNITYCDENKLSEKEEVERKKETINSKIENKGYKKIYQTENSPLIVEIPIENRERISKSISGISNEGYHYVGSTISISYRNQDVDKGDLYAYIHYINLRINILSGCSDDVVSVSRDSIKSEYVQKIKEPLKRIIIQWLGDNWDDFDDDGKKAASMFIEYYGNDKEKEDKIKRNKWRELNICGIEFGKKIKFDKIIMRNRIFRNRNEKKSDPKIKIITMDDDRDLFIGFVLIKCYNYGVYYRNVTNESEFYYGNTEVIFEKKSKKNMDWCFDRMDWSYWLKGYRERTARLLMPCYGYENLQIKEESIPDNVSEPVIFSEKKLYPRTVCPYIVKDGKLKWDCSDELIQWVYENRENEEATVDQIEEEFKDMETFFSDYVNANGEIIEKSDETEKNTESEAESKLIEGIDVNAKPETAPISPKQGRKTAKPKAASKSSKQVEEKAKSKAVPSAQKQGRKKKDSDKKEAKKPQKVKTKK